MLASREKNTKDLLGKNITVERHIRSAKVIHKKLSLFSIQQNGADSSFSQVSQQSTTAMTKYETL
jgi:hypothetical protein